MCTPPNTYFLRPTRVHNRNNISIGSAIFAQLTAECRRACPAVSFPIKMAPSHGTIWTPHLIHGSMDRPISRSNLPFPSRDMDPYLIHDSLSPPESWTQAASRSVQSFCGAHYVDRPTTDLQTDRQTDRLTDHATRSVTIGRIDVYVVLRCGLIISGQSNLTTGRTAAARGQFDAIRQVAPVCTLSATCCFGPTCVQIKRHLDRFSRFCTAHGRVSLYFTMDTTFPQIAPSYE